MSSTYTQLYVQIVFAVKYREALILPSWEEELFRYITGIITSKGQKLLAINGTRDHIHIFIDMKPTCCLSDLVREVKKSSTAFICSKIGDERFRWQEGFGAFSYSIKQKSIIINYIMNQKEHHKKVWFKEEYIGFLKDFEVEFKEEYLFEFFNDM